MKTLFLLALMGSLAAAARAQASSSLLAKYFGEDAAADAPVPAAPPAVVVALASSAARPGGWQAIARPKNSSPRGPHVPVWTHTCYPTPQAAVDAAEAACRRENAGYSCTGESYWSTRCDR